MKDILGLSALEPYYERPGAGICRCAQNVIGFLGHEAPWYDAIMLEGLAILGLGFLAARAGAPRSQIYTELYGRVDRKAPRLAPGVMPIDANSPVPEAWAVPIWSQPGPWPVRSWWSGPVLYDYGDEHNVAA